jgi:hypothetical protein
MAADSPLTAPWAYQDRGSMLGSSDHHQNSSATAAPASVGGLSSQPRRAGPRSRSVGSRGRSVSCRTPTPQPVLALVRPIVALGGVRGNRMLLLPSNLPLVVA